MAKEKNYRQITRIDGKNCFLEIMSSAFNIDKVQINFREYDVNKQGEKFTQQIDIFVDIEDFLLIINDVLSGRIPQMILKEKNRVENESKKTNKKVYPSEKVLDEYMQRGGMKAESLKKADAKRKAKGLQTYSEMYKIPNGGIVSRQFKIVPGLKADLMLKAEAGIGAENETGLIVSKFGVNPAQKIQIPLSYAQLKKLCLITKAEIDGYMSAKHIDILNENKKKYLQNNIAM